MRSISLLALLLAAALLAGGCNFTAPTPDADLAGKLSQLVYPAQAPLGPDLDIVVVRDDRQLQLVNRTPRAYADQQLWLNQQYVGLVPVIKIGTDNAVSLVECINEHGECYPVGSIFDPQRAYPIVLVELFDPATGQRHRVVSRLEADR